VELRKREERDEDTRKHAHSETQQPNATAGESRIAVAWLFDRTCPEANTENGIRK
jgi:hypothetical protein